MFNIHQNLSQRKYTDKMAGRSYWLLSYWVFQRLNNSTIKQFNVKHYTLHTTHTTHTTHYNISSCRIMVCSRSGPTETIFTGTPSSSSRKSR